MEVLDTFNDRVKWLYQKLGYKSGRLFDKAIGVVETNTAGITGPRQTTPKVEYVQKILAVHDTVNANWLLVGQGEWCLPPKKSIEDLMAELDAVKLERDVIRKENEGLRNSVVNLALFQAQTASSNLQNVANFKFVSSKKPVNQRVGIIIQFVADSTTDSRYSTSVIA